MKYTVLPILLFLLGMAAACSHKFDSSVLDLNFYQWNLWPDGEATSMEDAPSCGWEELHRGNGKLVRIPAMIQDHFSNEEGAKVFWYHCRFTLPEDWEEKEVILRFEGVGPMAKAYLNEIPVGSHRGLEGNFDIDVSEVIYYTRDNHLAIQVSNSEPFDSSASGISGTVQARLKTSP
jgi:beta-galactosidase/beta-glucuronidase